MKFILYRSVATTEFNAENLCELVARAETSNADHGISGLLVYADRRFFQWIEGEDLAVDALFSRIKVDPRHEHIDVLVLRDAIQRYFPAWGMLSHLVEPSKAESYLDLGHGALIQRFIQYAAVPPNKPGHASM